MPTDVGSTHSTAGRANETSAARPALSAPCDADVPCFEGYAVGEGDDLVRFVGSPTNDAECLEDGLLDPQQPVGTDIVGGELCQIAYQAAALNYLSIADLAGSEARCVNGQVDNPNSGASDAFQLGICGTVGAATGSVGNVQTDLYQTEAEAQCIAGQTTNPNPNAPDPVGTGACGEVGTAVEGADSTAGAAAGILTSDAGKLSLEFQCLENAVQYPTPGVPDPLGTGLCGDVGTAVFDSESGAATVVSTAESGVGQLAGALAAAAGQVGLEFQCLQNALQYPTPGVPDPLGTGICGDVGTAVFDTESGVNAALSVAGQIPGVVASAASQVGLEAQCLENAVQYPTPGVPDPLGTGLCGDVGAAVFDAESSVGEALSVAGEEGSKVGLEVQCLQNALQYPTPGVPDPLGTGLCGTAGTAVLGAESGVDAVVSAAGDLAGVLASVAGGLGSEFHCLENAVQYPTPGAPDPLGTGLCGDVSSAVSGAESDAGEALSVAGQIPGALVSAADGVGPEFQCFGNALQYPSPGVSDPLGTGLCGDVGTAVSDAESGAVGTDGLAEVQCLAGQALVPDPTTSDPLGAGICGDAGDVLETQSTAECAAEQITDPDPDPGLYDPFGLCGSVGTAVSDLDADGGPEAACLDSQLQFPNPGSGDPLGTGLCNLVGTIVEDIDGFAGDEVSDDSSTVLDTGNEAQETVLGTTQSAVEDPAGEAGEVASDAESLSPGSAAAQPAGVLGGGANPAGGSGNGFDICAPSSGSELDYDFKHSDWRFAGFYIGGVDTCSKNVLTKSTNAHETDAANKYGMGILAIWVGEQASCSSQPHKLPTGISAAALAADRAQGEKAAKLAADQMQSDGMGKNGFSVYYDVEAYNSGGSWSYDKTTESQTYACDLVTSNLIQGWSAELKQLGDIPGVYGSDLASNAEGWWESPDGKKLPSEDRADDVFVASTDTADPSPFSGTDIPDPDWWQHRIKQWDENHLITTADAFYPKTQIPLAQGDAAAGNAPQVDFDCDVDGQLDGNSNWADRTGQTCQNDE